MSVKNYITPSGLQRLRDELRFLLIRERPAVTQVVAWAASNGDRSENAEYIYGKKRLREIDRRIRFLTKRIDMLTVVEPHAESGTRAADPERVYFGAWVTIEDEDEAQFTYRIVGGDEIDLEKRHISVQSPVAK